ncbi:alanine dehydrogenase [Vagococcus fluvialis]|uniref:Alanine dehydrogenase n=2 Tax=Vagococcus fluvialis TaxID=2738 RepID=A0A369ALG0_9ENTE|nr:alanine dehydrogenase [Vagococcus fluvialis]MBO0478012.1 alanine dehydrogenase [Vagococcus fluvialis]MBO0483279.1 alanine dehydrogenase [Vagococcus fluvialis]MCM2139769.1 alanine dehydrogenase [Vagococcus fluvialis]RCX10011.1 L-alanine dehydrogenase [Vagococcus fluvialis]RST98519.1 alanine dehydrogenase [Vagococcus fluvialis]
MKIGIPKEIINNENRVALTPPFVKTLVDKNHEVVVETMAGFGSGFTDEEYVENGASIVTTAKEAWNVDLVLKVKEPKESEYGFFKEGLILFTYLHLAPVPSLTESLIKNKVTAIAYESVQLEDGSLPLLNPMSEIAGRMAPQTGAFFLQKTNGGSGILLSSVPGVAKGNVVIIGGGVAGSNAAKVAIGLGAKVRILDVNQKRLAQLEEIFGNSIETVMSNPHNIHQSVMMADLVIGAVLIPGRKAPTLVTEEMVKDMKPGSVIIDIAIDQGGIFATTDRTTNHDEPIITKHDVLHYAVPNMPGAVSRTSTLALTNNTLPYIIQLADKGFIQAVKENKALATGVNTHNGVLTYEQVAIDQEKEFTPLTELI